MNKKKVPRINSNGEINIKTHFNQKQKKTHKSYYNINISIAKNTHVEWS